MRVGQFLRAWSAAIGFVVLSWSLTDRFYQDKGYSRHSMRLYDRVRSVMHLLNLLVPLYQSTNTLKCRNERIHFIEVTKYLIFFDTVQNRRA